MPERRRFDGTEFEQGMSPYNEILANLASLNEIVNALFSGLAIGETPDDNYANLVFRKLRDHTWRLGFEFNEERPPPDFYDKLEREHRNADL
jgi:hypothetical protein